MTARLTDAFREQMEQSTKLGQITCLHRYFSGQVWANLEDIGYGK